MKHLLLVILLLINYTAGAQDKIVLFEFSAGLGAGWWIQETDYKIQNETETDWSNSRLSLDIPLNASILLNLKNKIHIGPGFTFRKLLAQKLYASSPFIPSFSTTEISENAVSIMQYYIIVETSIIESKKMNLLPGLKFGTFQLKSLHPDNANFISRIMIEPSLKLKFNKRNNISPFIEMYYSNLSFKSNSSLVYKRVHHIQSIGTKLGLIF